MRFVMRMLLVSLLVPTAVVVAQDNPLASSNKAFYGRVKDALLRSAEKVPEETYSFKPTEAVRSFGQILGHTVDSQYHFCSVVLGEKSPGLKVEQTKTSKADLVAAMKTVFTYCDKAYDGMTDASGRELVKLFGPEADTPKMGVLMFNNMHLAEHYGNLVTYMRLKNIVPPSSEPRPTPPSSAPQSKK